MISGKAFFFALLVAGLQAHVIMLQPVQRSSIWRIPAYEHLNPPVNFNDDAIYCGPILQEEIVTNCGVCGDRLTDPVPRDNEHGGKFDLGIITGTYAPGQLIDLDLNFTITHLGYFQLHLCEGLPETDECFLKNILPFADGSDRYPITEDRTIQHVTAQVRLPANVTCEHCILRLNYRGGSSVGDCHDGTEDYGCGLQQNFRNCADISIL